MVRRTYIDHRNHDHPPTKAAREKCRRAMRSEPPRPDVKRTVSVRLDPAVADWLAGEGTASEVARDLITAEYKRAQRRARREARREERGRP